MHFRLARTVREWLARRREEPEPEPARDEAEAWEEVRQAIGESEVAGVRLRRSFADLEAEVLRRRGRPHA